MRDPSDEHVFKSAIPWPLIGATEACTLALPAAAFAFGADLRLAVAEWLSIQPLVVVLAGALGLVARRTWALRLLPDGFKTRHADSLIPYTRIVAVAHSGAGLRIVLTSDETVALRLAEPQRAAAALRSRMLPSYRGD